MIVARQVRTDRRETHDIGVGTDAIWRGPAELDQNARRVVVRICHAQRLVDLEIANIRKPVGRVFDPSLRLGRSGGARGSIMCSSSRC